jgi:flagellar basal-body rod modification protein FlgD
MSQMAQLSSVEKLQSIDQTLSASTVAGELSLGASLIGKQVQWLNADGEPQLGTVTEVAHSADGTALQIGDQRVPLASLVRIAAAAASTD